MKVKVNNQVREVPLKKIPVISDGSVQIFLREGAKPPKSMKVLNRKYIDGFAELVKSLKNAKEKEGLHKVFGILRSGLHLGFFIALIFGIVLFATVHPATGIALGICGGLLLFGMGMYTVNRYYTTFGKEEPKYGLGKIPIYLFWSFLFPVMEEYKKVAYLEKVVERKTREFEQVLGEVASFFQRDTTLLKSGLVAMIEKLESHLEDMSHLSSRDEIREEETKAIHERYKLALKEFIQGKNFYN